ncbi:hypothetical protein NQ317_012160 [Molorchus minor]|uniref:Uncharacterized protein n=1 Tax=Molorchus minor TaxID=1323400 RepID=A0ABQ9K428_9CUCU|nr:hypothetical protein NQ317_012160 [Molorchus minor]
MFIRRWNVLGLLMRTTEKTFLVVIIDGGIMYRVSHSFQRWTSEDVFELSLAVHETTTLRRTDLCDLQPNFLICSARTMRKSSTGRGGMAQPYFSRYRRKVLLSDALIGHASSLMIKLIANFCKATVALGISISTNNCTMNNCESEEIVEAANIAISNLLPTKSRSLYDIVYNRLKKVVR